MKMSTEPESRADLEKKLSPEASMRVLEGFVAIAKSGTLQIPPMLTKSEIAELRRGQREIDAQAQKAFAHLRPKK